MLPSSRSLFNKTRLEKEDEKRESHKNAGVLGVVAAGAYFSEIAMWWAGGRRQGKETRVKLYIVQLTAGM